MGIAARLKRERRGQPPQEPKQADVAAAAIRARIDQLRGEREAAIRQTQMEFERRLAHLQGAYDGAIGELEKLVAPGEAPAPPEAAPEAAPLPEDVEAAAEVLIEEAPPSA